MLKALVLFSLAVCLQARPEGAPRGACGTFQPEHGDGDTPGTPYVVNLDSFPSNAATNMLMYTPGSTYQSKQGYCVTNIPIVNLKDYAWVTCFVLCSSIWWHE